MTAGPHFLIVAILLLEVGYADGQALPWPGEHGATQSAPSDWAAAQVKPWADAAAQAVPMLRISPVRPCIAEFAKVREEAEKKAKAAKAADQRHVTRVEMCEYVTAYAAAEERWIDFTDAGVRTCGIPTAILTQLQEVHARTERTRVKICTVRVAPNAPSPSWLRMHMSHLPQATGASGRQWRQ